MTVAAITATAAATASAPDGPLSSRGGRPHRAAAARTEELYTQFGRTVRGLCRALLRDAAEAEDAAQQTFLSAHRALLNGSRPREPAAWLAAIARNECWARIRTRMREPLPSDVLETRLAGGADPVAEALRRADLAALWTAIDGLPPAQREALLLREFGGLSYGELADALAVSEPAVESLLFRARRRLRAAFAALTGAAWLDALARLLAGGGAPVAAAKVAALGVGAAAVGSGAAVVPPVFDNHHPSLPPPFVRHVRKPARPVRPRHRPTPPPVVSTPATPPVHREEHRGGGRHESFEARSGDDRSGRDGGGGHDGGRHDGGGHDGGGRDGGGDDGH